MKLPKQIQDAVRRQKANATAAELLMMQKLLYHKFKFTFIYPVVFESTFFTADFFLPQYSLLIEIDGDYHKRSDQKMRDFCKDSVYEALGYNILRIKNSQVDTFNTLKIKKFKKQNIIKAF